MERVAYMRGGQLFYAQRKAGESITSAVVRAVSKKAMGPVTMWWSAERDGHDVYTANWFDSDQDVFVECEVIF